MHKLLYYQPGQEVLKMETSLSYHFPRRRVRVLAASEDSNYRQ